MSHPYVHVGCDYVRMCYMYGCIYVHVHTYCACTCTCSCMYVCSVSQVASSTTQKEQRCCIERLIRSISTSAQRRVQQLMKQMQVHAVHICTYTYTYTLISIYLSIYLSIYPTNRDSFSLSSPQPYLYTHVCMYVCMYVCMNE